ncbi:MAG: hypothetical protein JXR77_14555 [Lentisphaeria bacterium]|nr:hypothetical protein [Lentisphaeria bacterium]
MSMKWVGWVLAAVLFAAVGAAVHDGRRRIVAERAVIEEQLSRKRAEVEAVFERAGEGIPARRERLEQETRKAAELERQVNELDNRKTTLEQTVKDLTAAIDKLRTAKDEASDQREDNREQIRELQDKITQAERQVDLLRKAVEMVTEKTGT